MVGVRYPARKNICWRVRASFTGRPGSARAAIAARMTLACGVPFDPKPPPTNGQITRTCSSSSPNTLATADRAGCTPWVESHRVSGTSAPGSHSAVVACGSSGLLWYIAVV